VTVIIAGCPSPANGGEEGSPYLDVKQDGSGDYTTIQAAINAAAPGDTVMVHPGVYRETIVFPRGGTGESARITLKAAPGTVTITGSEIVPPGEWTYTSGNVYTLVKPNAYFGGFNPFAEKWAAKGSSYPDYFSCGCVYINDTVLKQVFNKSDVDGTNFSWFAEVETGETGNTTITVNFGGMDPRNSANITEINVRKQCVTAAWNQGYITIDGFTVIRGCGPKTINFAQWGSKPMEGAIATNGGYHWIIQNCEVYQNRGVAIDYGLGARGHQAANGGEPELYGYHIIRNCNVHDNGTNGIMAYRGAYTEIYGCTLVNNNALNTGLASEGYIKNVNGGFGINVHDNYFYSDQDYECFPVWYDCETDGSFINNNIFYSNGPGGKGFSTVFWEQGGGWSMCANNIFVNTGFNNHCSTNTFIVNNLFLNNTKGSAFPGNPNAFGAYGYNGYTRVLRAMKPGTLTSLGNGVKGDGASHYETFLRFSRLHNNIFFGTGVTSQSSINEVSAESYIGTFAEFVNVGSDPTDSWQPVGSSYTANATKTYGNECDYNVYYSGAQKINYQYASARGYTADANSIVQPGGSYSVSGGKDYFSLTLTVDASVTTINAPAITGTYLGKAALYESLGVDFYAPDVNTDFFGKPRNAANTVVGPFADLDAGTKTYQLWPR
jgi:hypothetical protein